MRTRRILSFFLLLCALSMLSCIEIRRSGAGSSCYDVAECEAEEGLFPACIEGSCRDVECLATNDCSFGQICDVDDNNYECIEGCYDDGDCPAGAECSDGQCVDYGCRSTLLDCDFGEVCNLASGECEPAEGPYCSLCDPTDNQIDDRGTPSTCDDLILGHDGCGGTGNYCLSHYTGSNTCQVSCETQEDCPAGFSCVQGYRPLPSACADDLLVLGKICVSDCEAAR